MSDITTVSPTRRAAMESDRPRSNTPARRHSAAHRAEYALVRSLEKAVSVLPGRAADAVGRQAGRSVHALGIRRSVVDSNLRLAFPDRDEDWISATALSAFEHLGREAAAMMRLSKLDANAVLAQTIPVGWEEVEEARSLGKGIILVTGHFGNWEMAAALVAARGNPIAAIVRRQGNRLVNDRLERLRKNLGVETIYQSQAPSRVPRILRANGVVGIVGDQDARRSGIFVPFMGQPASTHRGPALFAIRLGAPVFSCFARRLAGADVRYEVTAERVDFARTGDLDVDVHSLTSELAQRLEREVRAAPEQYFWFHKRWKTRPPATT